MTIINQLSGQKVSNLSLFVCNAFLVEVESIKGCKYASMQHEACNYASMQVCKYTSMQVWNYESMQVYKYVKYMSLQEYKKGVSKVFQGNYKVMHICCL